MATLVELDSLLSDPGISNKVRGALMVTAYNIKTESDQTQNHAARLAFAKQCLIDPNGMTPRVARYVVGANNAETLAVINALDDATIKAHVDASVDVFA